MRPSTFDSQHEPTRVARCFRSLRGAPIGILAVAALVGAAAPVGPAREVHVVSAAETEWIVEAEDSVCGVRKARQIRKPAKVRFKHLVAVTPEGKKIERERIDPDSAEGIRLMNRAKSRVRDASSVIMKRQGFDSVWKRISSRKGTHVVDVTAYVELEIGKAGSADVDGAL